MGFFLTRLSLESSGDVPNRSPLAKGEKGPVGNPAGKE
jgi:hypothetical protein